MLYLWFSSERLPPITPSWVQIFEHRASIHPQHWESETTWLQTQLMKNGYQIPWTWKRSPVFFQFRKAKLIAMLNRFPQEESATCIHQVQPLANIPLSYQYVSCDKDSLNLNSSFQSIFFTLTKLRWLNQILVLPLKILVTLYLFAYILKHKKDDISSSFSRWKHILGCLNEWREER